MKRPSKRKPDPTPVQPAWYQQQHANCGGMVIIVARNDTREWCIACANCKTLWQIQSPFAPLAPLSADFVTVEGLEVR